MGIRRLDNAHALIPLSIVLNNHLRPGMSD